MSLDAIPAGSAVLLDMAIFRLPDNYNGNFFEDFKAMIASRLHIAPILKARLEKAPLDIDHPSWVEDDQFDIDWFMKQK